VHPPEPRLASPVGGGQTSLHPGIALPATVKILNKIISCNVKGTIIMLRMKIIQIEQHYRAGAASFWWSRRQSRKSKGDRVLAPAYVLEILSIFLN
jgi:hypothetical protein